MGMAELLLGTALTEKQRRFAETVHKSCETLLSIINDILDFSKIEAGRFELETWISTCTKPSKMSSSSLPNAPIARVLS